MDMKGTGTLQLYAFLTLARQKVPLERDVILMIVPDEEIGGQLGARFMIENHYDELDPEYVLDEGGFGTREVYVDGRLVFGISVAEKQIVWLEAAAEGVAGMDRSRTTRIRTTNWEALSSSYRAFPRPVSNASLQAPVRWTTSSRTPSRTPPSLSPVFARESAILPR
jgi:acetylornithine deacetylase/succinyl-diaminopimelate desuccinylase-like protein